MYHSNVLFYDFRIKEFYINQLACVKVTLSSEVTSALIKVFLNLFGFEFIFFNRILT